MKQEKIGALFWENTAFIMRKRKMTVSDLSKMSFIPTHTIRKWRSEKTLPYTQAMESIAKALQVEYVDFFYEGRDKNDELPKSKNSKALADVFDSNIKRYNTYYDGVREKPVTKLLIEKCGLKISTYRSAVCCGRLPKANYIEQIAMHLKLKYIDLFEEW